jgi:hypothetical protein
MLFQKSFKKFKLLGGKVKKTILNIRP